jgi:hypothetical protein
LLLTAAGKNTRFPKGIVLLVKVARGDDGLGALVEGCDGVGCVILEEHDGQDVVKDKGNCPVVLAWLARGWDVVADPIWPNNLRPVGVEPSFLLTVAKAELRALKNATLLDNLLTSGVAALEGALVLSLAEGCPAGDKWVVAELATFEGLDDAFIAEARHETLEGEVDGGGTGFTVEVHVDSVKLLVIAELLVEGVPDERLVVKVLVDALLELAVGAGSITVHWSWSVGECVRAAGAGEHGKGTTQSQGPREGNAPTGGTLKEEQHSGWNNNGVPMCTVLKTSRQTSLRAEIYRPMAVYLRLLALLVAIYLGAAQCHNYSNNVYNKGGVENTGAQRLMYLFWLEGSGRQAEVRAGVGGDLFLC